MGSPDLSSSGVQARAGSPCHKERGAVMETRRRSRIVGICSLLAAASIVLCTGSARAQDATHDEVEHALRQGLLEVWRWLDQHGHDDKSGRYFEFFTRDGTPMLTRDQNPLRADRDSIGTHVGYKSMNTHIHLLESFTALLTVWPDPTLKPRTNELHAIVRDRIVAPPGSMHQFFNPDWTPVPDHDSFGHDIETAYLLLESAEALGMMDDPKTVATAKSLLDHGLDYAWDNKSGGFFETGGVFGPVYDKSKGWWTQAEGMNALLIMSRRFPDDPRGYRKLFDRQWAFVKKNVMDAEHGEWYPTALDAGGSPKAAKASEWKAPRRPRPAERGGVAGGAVSLDPGR